MWIRFLASFLCAVIFFVPQGAFAVVEISEIMYDLPGSDSGREWIELHNTGTESIDISRWKLFENEVHHGLVAKQGTVLVAGEYAIIADDIVKFSADWPQFKGLLFSSSFSLANTGELLVIKNASSTVIESQAYDSSIGARGNGNTLNLVNATFVERAPSPGSAVSAAPLPVKVSVDKRGNSSSKSGVSKSASALSSEQSVGSDLSGPRQVAVAQHGFQLSGFSGIIPWILALCGVIVLGGCAIFAMKKETGSGYRIIEEKK